MPYQLHCCKQLALVEEELTDDGATDEGVDERDDGATDEGVDDREDGATDEEAEPPEQTVPLTVGRSSAPPFLFNWKPKLADWPGGSVPFQPRLVAVYGLLPDTVAFHEPLRRLVVYCQFTDQPLIVEVVELVMIIVPVAPVFHSLSML